EQQVPGGFQGVVESRHRPSLEDRAEIDEYIPAADEIELGKRRILGHILLRKNTDIADGLRDPIAAIRLSEIAAEPFGGDLAGNALRIKARPGFLDGRQADVRGKDLNSVTGRRATKVLEQGYGDRVSLLTRRAAGHPH